ncbi:MAG: NusA-like transcription termination signal-binding factor [Sulfolobaceae archaeon]
MPEVKLTPEELKYMSLFQDVTRVTARDCIIDKDNDRLIFLVNPQDMGAAIGKGGINVKRLEKLLGKMIEIVSFSENLEELVKYLMAPARVRGVKLINSDSKKVLYVRVDPQDKGLAIGKGGRNVLRAKLVLKRYMDIDSVVIE